MVYIHLSKTHGILNMVGSHKYFWMIDGKKTIPLVKRKIKTGSNSRKISGQCSRKRVSVAWELVNERVHTLERNENILGLKKVKDRWLGKPDQGKSGDKN